MAILVVLAALAYFSMIALIDAQCPDYTAYAAEKHGPFSSGRYQLSYQRPVPSCRAFALPEVEEIINRTKECI
jgi:hypothetical protein